MIAAAGQHNLLMLGPPGVGKSMIATRISDLLPQLSHHQACILAALQSMAGGIDLSRWRQAPFRAPHHSVSARALVGGGQPVRPGEVSLAHHGLLFLDELTEFDRSVLESLREPLETGQISIARARDRITFPAEVMLVAAMNPCPCGYYGAQHLRRACRCSPDRILRYRSRISGPLMDRFDVAVQMAAPGADELSTGLPQETSEPMTTSEDPAKDVHRAREIQLVRQSCLNARLEPGAIEQQAALKPEAIGLMRRAASRWGWSARSWHRVLRVARTIADVAGSVPVELPHIAEAIELRRPIDIEPDLRAFESAR